MEIMHVISFCSYVKNSGCYGNKYIYKIKVKTNTDNCGVSPVGDHIAWKSFVRSILVMFNLNNIVDMSVFIMF